MINISNVIDMNGPIESLQPGTLLILYRQHTICNIMVYSEENCKLFFLKISMSTYMGDCTDLKNKFKNRDRSILKHYMDLCTYNREKYFNSCISTNTLHLDLP